jgi:hypothetical protein
MNTGGEDSATGGGDQSEAHDGAPKTVMPNLPLDACASNPYLSSRRQPWKYADRRHQGQHRALIHAACLQQPPLSACEEAKAQS